MMCHNRFSGGTKAYWGGILGGGGGRVCVHEDDKLAMELRQNPTSFREIADFQTLRRRQYVGI
jgi:hypothetical protein